MSKPNVTLEDEEKKMQTGADSEHTQSSSNINCDDPPRSTPDRLNLEPSIIARETSPSPSNNGTNLLSLPWEIVTQIASHLPAQCVINVLPQVCQALGRIGEDHLVWQLRAHKLCSRQTSFPVGPKDDFNWSKACLEMEQLIGLWTPQEDHTERQEQREIPDGAAGGVDGEVQESRMDVESNGAAEVEDGNMPVSSQNDPQGMDPDPITFSSSSSPLEHVVLPSVHIADVNCVQLLGGEGAMCASGSRDRNVNIWDLRQGSRGTLLHTLGDRGFLRTHRGWVWCLASNGPLLASGAFDSTIRVWDLAAGGAAWARIQLKAAVLCLNFERDTMLAGSHDRKIRIYDTRAPDPFVKSLRLHSDAVLCLASDDKFILSGSKDQTVALYDRRAGKLLQKVQVHTQTQCASSYLLSMSYSGGELWAGDNRGLVHTFSLHNGSLTPVSQFSIHSAMVTGIHYSSGTLYTCSSDRTVKIHLPCAPPKTLCTLHHQSGVNGLSVEADTLAIASADMNVEVWRPRC